ncbi:MAG: TetR/AcrR family transcriptional regulator, partial [Chloroflexota bacterium]
STVYRYFSSKVDILIAFHDHIFKHIRLVAQEKSIWLADGTPQSLINLFTIVQDQYRYRPLYAKLGNEAGYFTRELRSLLVQHFEDGLRKSFNAQELSVPITYLARSLVGLFLEMFLWFCEAPEQHEVIAITNHIHQSMQSVIKESIKIPALA